MDSLTQIILGAAVGEVVLGKKVGNKAMLWGGIAGTIPDLDVLVTNFFEPIDKLMLHRGFSHSIVFALLFAPLLGWLINKIYKKNKLGWKPWAYLSFWGLFTHPLLDCFTTWGTQLFWPLPYRVSFNSIFVIDPFYTVPFMFFVIWAAVLKKDNPKRFKINLIGLCLTTFLLLFTLVDKAIATSAFKAALKQREIKFKRIEAKPMPLTNFYWTCLAETDSSFFVSYYSLFNNKVEPFKELKKNYNLLKSYGLSNNKTIQNFKFITKGFYSVEEINGELILNDLRFGQKYGVVHALGKGSIFSYKVVKTKNGLRFIKQRENMQEFFNHFSEYWSRVYGIGEKI